VEGVGPPALLGTVVWFPAVAHTFFCSLSHVLSLSTWRLEQTFNSTGTWGWLTLKYLFLPLIPPLCLLYVKSNNIVKTSGLLLTNTRPK
jgi:hypothetical protein